VTHDEIAGLLGAFALDAVDPDERAAVEAHLADCPRCRAEVAEHREVAALLANEGGQAPDGLWPRIAGSLEAPPPDLRLVPAPRPEPAPPVRRWSPSRIGLGLVAAAAAVAIVVLGGQVVRQGDRIDQLEAAASDPLAPALEAALDDPGSDVLELASNDGRLALRGAVTVDGTGYLRAASLPALPDGRTYQLWGISGGEEPVSLGVLGREPGVVTFSAEGYDGFAVTEEAAPGAPAPTQDPLVTSSA
jgi:anti-sigma-K factor RskA